MKLHVRGMSKLQRAIKSWWKWVLVGLLSPDILVITLLSNSCLWFIGGTILWNSLKIVGFGRRRGIIEQQLNFLTGCLDGFGWVGAMKLAPHASAEALHAWWFCSNCALCVCVCVANGEMRPAPVLICRIVAWVSNLCRTNYQTDWGFVDDCVLIDCH